MNYFCQSRFGDRYLAGLELFHFFRVVIDANHLMADISETGACHQTDVSGTDDEYIHESGRVWANQPQHKWRNSAAVSAAIRHFWITRPTTKDRNLNRNQISGML